MTRDFSDLVKDASVHGVLQRLREDLGGEFVVCDHWDADLYAVAVAKIGDECILAYISTYRRSPGEYYLELEVGVGDGTDSQKVGVWESIGYLDLCDRVAAHLGLKEPGTR